MSANATRIASQEEKWLDTFYILTSMEKYCPIVHILLTFQVSVSINWMNWLFLICLICSNKQRLINKQKITSYLRTRGGSFTYFLKNKQVSNELLSK